MWGEKEFFHVDEFIQLNLIFTGWAWTTKWIIHSLIFTLCVLDVCLRMWMEVLYWNNNDY